MSDISFDFTPKDIWMISQAKSNGILIPEIAMLACRWIGFNFAVTCAVLEVESGGGKNIYGGDPTIFEGHHNKLVTQQNYHDYKLEREFYDKNQGVGPMQLTQPDLQDEADRIGGCWNPMCNVLTGVNFLNKKRDTTAAQDSWLTVFNAWNDSIYAQRMVDERIPKWQSILANPH